MSFTPYIYECALAHLPVVRRSKIFLPYQQHTLMLQLLGVYIDFSFSDALVLTENLCREELSLYIVDKL
jgi:hypothetical protein